MNIQPHLGRERRLQNVREIRGCLFHLIALHVLFFSLFVCLSCFHYLIPQPRTIELWIGLTTDSLYFIYTILLLVAIKFKYEGIFIASIFCLISSFLIKSSICYLFHNFNTADLYPIVEIIFLLVNSLVPWSISIIWN